MPKHSLKHQLKDRHKRTVFITGAAAGIGRAIATLFASQGWIVGAADIDEIGLVRLREEIGNDLCLTYRLDVTSAAEWQAALADFHNATGRLDALINNAGILASGPYESIPLEKQTAIIDINVKGVMTGCYSAFNYLKDTPDACVVNLASASAIYGQPSLATYSASKFAVKGLTEALNLEWEAHDIRVLDMLPLFVQTAMVTDMDAQSIKNLGVHLTADDVAARIMKAVNSGHSASKVHWTVGTMTALMYSAANLSPDWINRAVNRWISKKK